MRASGGEVSEWEGSLGFLLDEATQSMPTHTNTRACGGKTMYVICDSERKGGCSHSDPYEGREVLVERKKYKYTSYIWKFVLTGIPTISLW